MQKCFLELSLNIEVARFYFMTVLQFTFSLHSTLGFMQFIMWNYSVQVLIQSIRRNMGLFLLILSLGIEGPVSIKNVWFGFAAVAKKFFKVFNSLVVFVWGLHLAVLRNWACLWVQGSVLSVLRGLFEMPGIEPLFGDMQGKWLTRYSISAVLKICFCLGGHTRQWAGFTPGGTQRTGWNARHRTWVCHTRCTISPDL